MPPRRFKTDSFDLSITCLNQPSHRNLRKGANHLLSGGKDAETLQPLAMALARN